MALHPCDLFEIEVVALVIANTHCRHLSAININLSRVTAQFYDVSWMSDTTNNTARSLLAAANIDVKHLVPMALVYSKQRLLNRQPAFFAAFSQEPEDALRISASNPLFAVQSAATFV